MNDQHRTSVYVRMDDYEDIIDIINLTRNKIQQAKAIIDRIWKLKQIEDKELDKWHADIEEVEHKIEDIDGRLFRPQTP